MVKPHLSPRAAAVQLLNGVLLEGKLIAELLAENILAPLAPEARARAAFGAGDAARARAC